MGSITGTSHFDVASIIHCSPLVPCPGMKFIDITCYGFAPNDMPNVLYRNWPELLMDVILSLIVPAAQRSNCLQPGPDPAAAGCDPPPH